MIQLILQDSFAFFSLVAIITFIMIMLGYKLASPCPIGPLQCFCEPEENIKFTYEGDTGTNNWKCLFPHSAGYSQSPINIVHRSVRVQNGKPLKWCYFDEFPMQFEIVNDFHTVTMFGMWRKSPAPTISEGNLIGSYVFQSLCFRWGRNSSDGTEHMIDFNQFAMELQVMFIRKDFDTPCKAMRTDDKDSVVIISYLFKISPVDNPYLDQVVNNLNHIRESGSFYQILPFPLRWLCPPFENNYYSYSGSFTMPPCTEVVTWLIQSETLPVSAAQVSQFRKLKAFDGPINTNVRPVQLLNDRLVSLYS